MIGFKLLSVACWIGVVLAQQDYQQQQEYHRPAPLRIGTNAVETKPTPIPILKQINSSERGEYYRKRYFTAARNNCKLRSAEKTRSKYNPKALNFAVDGNSVQKQQQKEQQQGRNQNGGSGVGGGSVGSGPTGPALLGGKKLFKKF